MYDKADAEGLPPIRRTLSPRPMPNGRRSPPISSRISITDRERLLFGSRKIKDLGRIHVSIGGFVSGLRMSVDRTAIGLAKCVFALLAKEVAFDRNRPGHHLRLSGMLLPAVHPEPA